MSQPHAERQPRKSHDGTDETSTVPAEPVSTATDGIDDLLDDIDDVLESNAEEFVKSYIQQGGQ